MQKLRGMPTGATARMYVPEITEVKAWKKF
jgi:hypothetical protein